ncbi:hypothetical protein PQ459_09995 [Chryseobacterium sp. KACC 21268]|nr:hypothetical protein PQ459_09995 [Chryseobacterium sp. KACC 21268]
MKKTKSKNSRKPLRNGCSRTQFYFSPENLLSSKSNETLEKDCFIECRFHDPKFKEKYPSGFQFRKRLNEWKKLSERQAAAKSYKEEMEKLLDLNHYNPITKIYMSDESLELGPHTDFKTAIEKGRLKLSGSEKHLNEVRIAMIRFCKGLDIMNYSFMNISSVKIWHIINTLESLELGSSYYNKFRQYLSDIFKELIQRGCIEYNPVRDISKKKTNPKIRELISAEKLKYIDKYLIEKHYNFYRYKEIFYRSGSRSSEMFRIQRKHVNLESQEYIMQIQKGSSYKWVTKAINVQSLKYWKEIIKLCTSDEDYLFSINQEPGSTKVSEKRVTRKWYDYVKNGDNIKDENGKVITVTEDFYAFKSMYLDELDAIQHSAKVIPIDFNIAQAAASHTSDKTTSIYAVKRNQRQLDYLKNVKTGT